MPIYTPKVYITPKGIDKGNRMSYSTDLTDSQWQLIEPVFQTKRGKNFVKHSKRDLVNAVLYLVKTGCQWRLLPNDFPPYTAVWSFYRRTVINGNGSRRWIFWYKKHVRKEVANRLQPTGSSIPKA